MNERWPLLAGKQIFMETLEKHPSSEFERHVPALPAIVGMRTATRLTFWTAVVPLLLLASTAPTARAATIAVGAYTPSTTSPFTVPIMITGVFDLVTWQFSLDFDPTQLQVDDDFISDPNPVREGPFTSSGGANSTFFVPGFIFNSIGLLDTVAGGYVDLPPGPSGDGVLAYVDFTALSSDPSPITVGDPAVTSDAPEPAAIALLGAGLVWIGVRRRNYRLKRQASNLSPLF